MADDQNKQKGDGGGKRQVSGVSIGAVLEPKDLVQKETMAGLFTTLLVGAFSILILNKAINPIRRRLFGLTEAAPLVLKPNEIVEQLKNPSLPEGNRKWVFKESFGTLTAEGKAQMKEWINNQDK